MFGSRKTLYMWGVVVDRGAGGRAAHLGPVGHLAGLDHLPAAEVAHTVAAGKHQRRSRGNPSKAPGDAR